MILGLLYPPALTVGDNRQCQMLEYQHRGWSVIRYAVLRSSEHVLTLVLCPIQIATLHTEPPVASSVQVTNAASDNKGLKVCLEV